MKIAAYRDEDAADIAALMTAIPELPSTSADAFRGFAALSFNRQARDFRALRVDHRLVGLLTSTLLDEGGPVRHFRIAIHPAYRRRRLGTELLAEVLRQPAPSGTRLQCNSQDSWHAGNAFLERAGFQVARSELLMRRAIRGAEVDAPPGFVLRPSTVADDEAWIALHAQAYRAQDGTSELTRDDVRAERDSPGFCLIVAEQRGEVVGYCHALELEASEVLINSLVVRSDVRGQGLGAALLSTCLGSFAATQVMTASLSVVSTHRAAIAVYERLGFQTYDRMLTYQRLHT